MILYMYVFLVPGVSQFVPLETPNDSPAVIKGLTQDDLSTIHRKFWQLRYLSTYLLKLLNNPLTWLCIYLFSELGNLPTQHLMDEVKRLQNIAYQLGLEETKEMTRGKYLNILRKRRWRQNHECQLFHLLGFTDSELWTVFSTLWSCFSFKLYR